MMMFKDHSAAVSIKSVLKQIYILVVALTAITTNSGVEARPKRTNSKTVCLVADSIQLHNSSKKWWWSPNRDAPVISSRPTSRHFSQEWIVFATPGYWGTTVAEFGHKTTDGNCRFLVRRGDSVHFGRETRCRPHVNGRGSYFTISFDMLSNREQIMTGLGQDVAARDNVFLGVRGNKLHVTSLRSSFMRWWKINFSNKKHC